MSYDFDHIIDRQETSCIKWKLYGQDVLPFWVADMDFPAPEPVQFALRRAVDHGIFGYEFPTQELRETIANRMERLYDWQISPEAIVATPGVIAGFVAAANAVCSPGEGILVQPPVYPPFLTVHEKTGLARQVAPLKYISHNHIINYEMDFKAFTGGLNSAGVHTAMFLLCNPHNPTGQVYSRFGLERMGEICLKNGSVI